MINKELLKFIKQARKRGFSDLEIKKVLMQNNWPIQEIEKAFISLQPKPEYKY